MLSTPSRRLNLCVIGLLALSFSVSVVLVFKASPQQAFFNSAGRIWQLLAGATLGLGMLKKPISARIASTMRLVGVLLFVVSIGMYSSSIGYPGVAALAPVFGCFLLIAAPVQHRDILFNCLVSPPLRFIGKISYSLYLWHWPLLVFAKLEIPELSKAQALIISGFASLLATASTFLLEDSIRQHRFLKRDRSFAVAFGFSLIALGALASLTIYRNGMPERWGGRQGTYELGEAFDRGHCFHRRSPTCQFDR